MFGDTDPHDGRLCMGIQTLVMVGYVWGYRPCNGRLCVEIQALVMVQGCHRSGKSQGKNNIFKVREKSDFLF